MITGRTAMRPGRAARMDALDGLFAGLDRLVGASNYLVALTADHRSHRYQSARRRRDWTPGGSRPRSSGSRGRARGLGPANIAHFPTATPTSRPVSGASCWPAAMRERVRGLLQQVPGVARCISATSLVGSPRQSGRPGDRPRCDPIATATRRCPSAVLVSLGVGRLTWQRLRLRHTRAHLMMGPGIVQASPRRPCWTSRRRSVSSLTSRCRTRRGACSPGAVPALSSGPEAAERLDDGHI